MSAIVDMISLPTGAAAVCLFTALGLVCRLSQNRLPDGEGPDRSSAGGDVLEGTWAKCEDRPHKTPVGLENHIPPAQVPEHAKIRDDQRHAVFIPCGNLAQGQAPVFEAVAPRNASAVAVINRLICATSYLPREALADIVPEAEGAIPAAAVQFAKAYAGANLIG